MSGPPTETEKYAGKILAIPAVKGREAPPDGAPRPRACKSQFDTPSLPFETESMKFRVRRPVPPKRVQTSMTKTRPLSQKMAEGSYAVRFADFTWAHTDTNGMDHYANRREIVDIANNYDTTISKIITEVDDLERASAYQAAADMLMDEIENQMRVQCLEQSELVERARVSYAHIFELMLKDAHQCRITIQKLEEGNIHLEENLSKVIDNATERVKDAQEDCRRQVAVLKKEMDDKKDEYDTSMKRFLEQKSQLEEHVKALHRVFLDFQSDSVYITLEDLKQKQENLEKKIKGKDAEIAKLNQQLAKLQKQLKEADDNKLILEQANDELRRKLQMAMAQANRLQRRLDMQNLDDEAYEGENDEDGDQGLSSEDLPDKPLINSETVAASAQKHIVRKRQQARVDPAPYLHIHQKLSKISDKVLDIVQKLNTQPMLVMMTDNNNDAEKVFLTYDTALMLKAIDTKAEDVARYVECLEGMELKQATDDGNEGPKNIPRFLRYISQHTADEVDAEMEKKVQAVIYQLVRRIYQSKYICDQWHQRMGQPLVRFPEFVISYYCKDGGTMFTALLKSARIWRLIQGSEVPELKLFRKFLLEKYTVDELSFFLEMRTSLLGILPIGKDDPEIITIPVVKCRAVMETVLGTFSPVLHQISQEVNKRARNGSIDYAEFIRVMLKFYRNERRKRRNAVRLMFQSRRFTQGQNNIDFENFVAMIQTLGFQGSVDEIFALFREGSLIAGGDITLDALLDAMDNLSFHFYSIELPVRLNKTSEITTMTRQQITTHWTNFMGWFDGFMTPRDNFDTWLRSRLVRQVLTVDKLFKTNAPIHSLFTEYRTLLDYFQFMLNVLAKGQSEPLPAEKSDRELDFMENMIDLLVTFIFRKDEGENILFTEFE